MAECLPRPEHPTPQFQRNDWLNLNGIWNFDFDFGQSGEERGWPANPSGLTKTITVPFCPECSLSGIEFKDFIPAVWYSRMIKIPENWSNNRVIIHFGAVDYHCIIWVNGKEAGQHYGGSSSFKFDITELLVKTENCIVVCANDNRRSGIQPSGKQSRTLYSRGASYSRITGIWQTVWLEAVSEQHLSWIRIVPNLDNGQFILTPSFEGTVRGHILRTILLDGEKVITFSDAPANSGTSIILDVKDPQPWAPQNPHLYNFKFELIDGNSVIDQVQSYAGLRKFHIEGNKFYLNNEPIFLRFVLDQGFYKEGLWTAPDDSELRGDIERSMAVGFNGARLHQKVFEERFHYWADHLGYLTWGEFSDWGMDFGKPQAVHNHQREWQEILLRDLNHPSIVAWTPFNETIQGAQNQFESHRQALQETYDLTRALDSTRPCHDTSGYVHVCTDIFSVHNYEQDPEKLKTTYESVSPKSQEETIVRFPELSVPYKGQPYVVAEYGGTWWVEQNAGDLNQDTDRKGSWGYGNRPKNIEEVYDRINKLTAVIAENPNIAGYTYTQLTDIEQEQNGIYTYDRKLKFDAARLKNSFGVPAAIEKT